MKREDATELGNHWLEPLPDRNALPGGYELLSRV
jgi:hypothetical protein